MSYTDGRSIVPPSMPAKIGHRSEAMRVIGERLDASGGYVISPEGLAGRSYVFRLQTPTGERSETVSVTWDAVAVVARSIV